MTGFWLGLALSLVIEFFPLLWLLLWYFHFTPAEPEASSETSSSKIRTLKPRSPLDCPCCQLAANPSSAISNPVNPVAAWPHLKSRRDRPKAISSQGFTCPNSKCLYFGIADQALHALAADGKHGKAEVIQTFKCQACRTTFTARRHTPLYCLKTPSAKVAQVLMAMAEGVDLSAAERIFGHRASTVATWLSRAGQHSQSMHKCWISNLHLPHLQLDEIRTRLRSKGQVLWLWLAIDPLTKLVPALLLGPRTHNAAYALVHTLKATLVEGLVPIFSSDGLNAYYYALSAHFGHWQERLGRAGRLIKIWEVDQRLLYVQVKKSYKRYRIAKVTHLIRCGSTEAFKNALLKLGLSGKLNTAFIERLNLTVRRSVSFLARRTWSTAQLTSELLLHLEWTRAYYHFARPHESLRLVLAQPRARGGKLLPQRYHKRTPAMAAGLSNRIWKVEELLKYPLPPLREEWA